MQTNEKIVRDVYAAAEGKKLDLQSFVALFGENGYFMDMATGQKWIGDKVSQPAQGLASSFPDFHRELLEVRSAADGVVIVELRLQGTHEGNFTTPAGQVLAATGKRFDVPCCDVFTIKDGKVESFHCYNMSSLWLDQLGVSKR